MAHFFVCNTGDTTFLPNFLQLRRRKLPLKKFFIHSFIYLTVLCLSYSMRRLCCIKWNLSLWLTGSLVMVWGFSCSHACRILVPWPGIKPTSLALQGILNDWATRKVPTFFFFFLNKNSLNGTWMPGPVFRASHFLPWPPTQKQLHEECTDTEVSLQMSKWGWERWLAHSCEVRDAAKEDTSPADVRA